MTFSSDILRGSTEGVAGNWLTPVPPGVSNQRNLLRGFHTHTPVKSPPSLNCWIQTVCAAVLCVCARVETRVRELQFMSMVLKTHSVNFLSLAADVCDSSCSRWLSSQSLLICAWSLTFSSRSCRGDKQSWTITTNPNTTIEEIVQQMKCCTQRNAGTHTAKIQD